MRQMCPCSPLRKRLGWVRRGNRITTHQETVDWASGHRPSFPHHFGSKSPSLTRREHDNLGKCCMQWAPSLPAAPCVVACNVFAGRLNTSLHCGCCPDAVLLVAHHCLAMVNMLLSCLHWRGVDLARASVASSVGTFSSSIVQWIIDSRN